MSTGRLSTRIAPLRGTGCQTCRNRKVKCGIVQIQQACVFCLCWCQTLEDENHPVCRRCEKGGFTCLGYERRTHFINERAREKRRSSRVIRASRLEESQPVTGTEVLTLDRLYDPNPRSTPLPLSNEINLSAFEATIQLSFLSQNLFSGSSNNESSPSMADSWLHSSIKEMDPNTLSYNAVRALGAAFFGNVFNQPDITREGLQFYGKSLHMLNRDLNKISAVQSIEPLKNVMILGLYEVGEYQQCCPLAKSKE